MIQPNDTFSRRRFLQAAATGTLVSLPAVQGLAWAGDSEPTTQPGLIPEKQFATSVWLNDRSVVPVEDCIGKWVWCGDENNPRHLFLFVRGNVAMDEAPLAARLHVTAEDRYLLYLNGHYLGRGPARSFPDLRSYDTYDVASFLKKGKNVVAIRAYHYGIRFPEEKHNYCSGARAGVWCQLEYQNSKGEKCEYGTNNDWRAKNAEDWSRTTDRINPCHGFIEIRDGRKDIGSWMVVDFDDSAWQRTQVIPADDAPWIKMEARYTPLLRERELVPTEVVKTSEVLDKKQDVELTELLVTETHLSPKHVEISDSAALLKQDGNATIVRSVSAEGEGIFNPIILVDFGRQLFGFPRITLTAPEGVTIDMTYGQSLLGERIPAVTPRFGRWGDRYVTRKGKQTWEVAEYKQFRFLQIAVRGSNEPVQIHSVVCNQYGHPTPQRGKFECSDPMLSKLWQAAVDTAYLEMEDVLVCDAWRERNCHVDVPDPHGSVQAAYVAFGDVAVTDRKLLLTPQAVYDDGQVRMKFWREPRSLVYTNLTMLWSNSIREHFLHTGRRQVLEKVYPTMRTLIDWYEPHVKKDDLLHELPGGRTFVDWAPLDLKPPSFVINARYVKALEDAAWVATEMNRPDDARRWTNIADKVRQSLRLFFWSEEKGVYGDSLTTGSLAGVSEIGNGVALQSRIATGPQIARIAEAFRSGRIDMVRTTPLAIGHVAEGLIMSGYSQEGLNLLNRYSHMMESAQHPTIWESWDTYDEYNKVVHIGGQHVASDDSEAKPHPGRSLAHGGGAMVAKVITSHVLGVIPTGPGFSKCRIEPHPGDLKWARGVVPTPHGDIKVEWRKEANKLKLDVDLPPGVIREDVS